MPLPAAHHAPHDFDFILGDWRVHHRRLNTRLAGCDEWTSFEGLSSTRQTLGGFGNVEDNVLHVPDGDVRAIAMRSYDRATMTWAIWWLDGRHPHRLDVPVVGRFSEGTGVFYAEDSLEGRPIRVRFIWRPNPATGRPTWEQAFSADAGATWETNWTMAFTRLAPS